jgi:hypothetical protein
MKRSVANSLALLVLIVLSPAVARAQEPAHSLEDLQSLIRVNDTITLERTNGNSIKGRVENISASSLKLKIHGKSEEFRQPEIHLVRIHFNDPIKNGLILGTIIGGVGGAVIGAGVSDAFCDGCGNNAGGGAAAFGLFGAGIGAGVGALADYLHQGNKTVFVSQPRAALRFHVAPLVSQKAKGVSLALRF